MNSRRILCVHNGPELDELRGLLEQDGYEVLNAADGVGALDVLSSHEVDGVILDSDLVAPGGFSLRSRIRHACPELPMLLFSDFEDVKRLPLRVFRAYISGPDSPGAVLADFYN